MMLNFETQKINQIGQDPKKLPVRSLPENKTRLLRRVLWSGDGGNRTRVRKTRPSKIYERSRLELSPQATHPAKLTCDQPLGPEGPLSRR